MKIIVTKSVMLQATGGNNLEHTVTNAAVKQRIIHLIGVYEPLLESFVGRNLNDLAIPPGGLVRLHMA